MSPLFRSPAVDRGMLRASLVLAAAWSCAFGALPLLGQDRPTPAFGLSRTLDVPFDVAGFRLADLSGGGKDSILVVGSAGELRTFSMQGSSAALPDLPAGAARLPVPGRTILALARLQPGKSVQLLSASPKGVFVWPATPAGGVLGTPVPVSAGTRRHRPRFRLRVGRPVFAEICRDMNADGRADLLLPTGGHTELWLNTAAPAGSEKGAPAFRRVARLAVQVRRGIQSERHELSDIYESAFTIPRLKTRDVNGDGRKDLLVEDGRDRAFHLQQPDGTIPPEPTVRLDLRKFRDTTPRAALRPGRTLAGGDRQSMQTRDLDADGIPDYVIAHRRKIWVFHGTKEGPQFTKFSQILRTADDITTLLLADLDSDSLPDLIVVRIQVPTVAALVLSALGSFDVEVDALGYAGTKERRFERKPRWKGTLTVTVPPVLSILKNPDAIIRRFEKASERFVESREADIDGDGRTDLIQADPDRPVLRIWTGAAAGTASTAAQGDALLRQVLFEDRNRNWDLDRIVQWLGDVADSEVRQRTGGRPPDLLVPLRTDAGLQLVDWRAGDLRGDGRASIVVGYRRSNGGSPTVLDIHRKP